jgi:hypothetical protein
MKILNRVRKFASKHSRTALVAGSIVAGTVLAPSARATDPTTPEEVSTTVSGGAGAGKTAYVGYAALSAGIFLAGVVMWASRKGVGVRK